MSEPFNLDALTTEAIAEPFRFTFGGEDYEIPVDGDIRVAIALRNGDFGEMLRHMLGDEQWQRLLESPARFTIKRLEKLAEAYAAHVGTTVGESEASSSSSNGTAGRSKRTSSGTTQPR